MTRLKPLLTALVNTPIAARLAIANQCKIDNHTAINSLVGLLLLCWLLLWSSVTCAGQFKAGYHQIQISPNSAEKIQLINGSEQPVQQISDPLYAKAIYLSDGNQQVAIATIDLIHLPHPQLEQLQQQLQQQLQLDQLIVNLSHSHSAQLSHSGKSDLKQKLNQLLTTAKAKQQPVQIAASQQQSQLAYNRIITEGQTAQMLWSNPQRQQTKPAHLPLTVINLLTLEQKPYLTLVSYNAHPVITMNRSQAVISADYPAYLSRALKQQYGSDSLFLLGAAGDINPFDAGIADGNSAQLPRALQQTKLLAQQLTQQILQQLQQLTASDYQVTGQLITQQQWQPLTAAAQDKASPIKRAQINTLLIGNKIALASFSGEFFSQFGKLLQQHSPVETTVFVGYSNGSLGYIPTEAALQYGGYGAEPSELRFTADTGRKQVITAAQSLQKLYKQAVLHRAQ